MLPWSDCCSADAFRSSLPALTQEWQAEYDAALTPGKLLDSHWPHGPQCLQRSNHHTPASFLVLTGPPDEVLVDHPRSSIQLTRRDMACMAPLQWLNDEVINLYISLLLERDAARRKEVRVAVVLGRLAGWLG